MTLDQTILDGRKLRDWVADRGLDCEVSTNGRKLVINFGDEDELFETLEEAVEAVRDYAGTR